MQKITNYRLKQNGLLLLFVISLSFSITYSYSQSNSEIQKLELSLIESKDSCEKVKTFDKLARIYISTSVEKAIKYSERGIELAKKENCKKELGDIYNTSSVTNFYDGNITKAFLYVDSSIQVHYLTNNKKGLAAAVGNKGSFYNNIGSYNKSLELQYQCLRLNEELGDKSAIATTYTNIFIVFYAQKNYKKALKAGLEAYRIFEELSDKEGLAVIGCNIGILYKEKNNIDSCFYYLNQSEKLFLEMNNVDGLADTYRFRGEALEKSNRFQLALEYAEKAGVIYNSIGQRRKKIELYKLISSIYFGLNDYDKSKEFAFNLLKEGDLQGEKQFQQDAAELLMKNFEATNDFKRALEYNNLYHYVKNEMLNETTLNEINRLSIEFDFERKENELKSANQQKQILKLELDKKNSTLYGMITLFLFLGILTVFIIKQKRMKTLRKTFELNQKVLRTQMNPHFIFNALNSIQRIYVEGDIKKANNYMADFSQLMRKVLDNSSSNEITLTEEMETLRLYLELEKLRCKDCFTYRIDIDDSLSLNVKVPPLLLQPFVENSIWHGVLPLECNKGFIVIKIVDFDEDTMKVIIEDNGVGFDPKILTGNKNSKGISISRQRINHPVHMESTLNVGTVVSFKLAKKYD